MNNDQSVIFERYSLIVDLIGESFSTDTEVVLHNFSDPKHSIIKIINGHVTGRKVGDPITDLALSVWKKRDNNMLLNYKSKTKDGRILRSSTLFIEDDEGNIIGCLCINQDMTYIIMLKHTFDKLYKFDKEPSDSEITLESFTEDIYEVLDFIIDKAIEEISKPIAIMNKDEKLTVVNTIESKGGFFIKGAVDVAAKRLNVSRYTIYNYLEEIKANKNENIK